MTATCFRNVAERSKASCTTVATFGSVVRMCDIGSAAERAVSAAMLARGLAMAIAATTAIVRFRAVFAISVSSSPGEAANRGQNSHARTFRHFRARRRPVDPRLTMRAVPVMTTSPERWATVERLYHAALAQAADTRAAFLADACRGDEELRQQVESLLAQGASADVVLTGGGMAAAARLVSHVGGSALTGRRLGAYHILAPLGAGGMGEVYRARDTRLGRDVAVKILPHAFTTDSDRLARFEREARVLASLNHPHIAAIYGIEDTADVGAGFSRPTRALILELVEGETLAERITRAGTKGLPLKEALDIARQIADALDAAHEKGIVHRDLKPANIKITPLS